MREGLRSNKLVEACFKSLVFLLLELERKQSFQIQLKKKKFLRGLYIHRLCLRWTGNFQPWQLKFPLFSYKQLQNLAKTFSGMRTEKEFKNSIFRPNLFIILVLKLGQRHIRITVMKNSVAEKFGWVIFRISCSFIKMFKSL